MEHLIQGSRGNAVVTLKNILNEIGYSLECDDNFCEATTKAIVDFQKSVSITPDGNVGDITWAFLLNVQEMKNRNTKQSR